MAPTAGYSGTPLPNKLGIKDGFRVTLLEMPPDVRRDLKDALATCKTAKEGEHELDFVMIFVKTQTELKPRIAEFAKRLAPAGMLWVSWPKKASGVATDLTENEIRGIGLACGLVDIKVCAVSEVWSGLKFVIPLKKRPKI